MALLPYIAKETKSAIPKDQVNEAVLTTPEEKYLQNLETTLDEGELAVDVYETDEAVVIQSTIAGVRAEDLEITLSGDMLTIKGARRREIDIPEHLSLYQECFWGPFSRSIILPVDVKFERIDAKMKNGVLTLVLPKANRERMKVISVKNDEE